MRSIVEVVKELMDMNTALAEIEDDDLYDEMVDEIDNKIEEMWREYDVDEVLSEIENKEYYFEKWDFIDYIWKTREYMMEV